MSGDHPIYFSILEDEEKVVRVFEEPSREKRLQILCGLAPFFAFLVLSLFLLRDMNDQPGARPVLLVILVGIPSLFVFWLRLCRTRFVITSRRAIRLVAGMKTEEIRFVDCQKPSLVILQESPSAMYRWFAKLLSTKPSIRLNRIDPLPMTLNAFLRSRDPAGMNITMVSVDMSADNFFEDVLRAWEATA